MAAINLLANSSFDIDSNDDGLADYWSTFGSPTTTLDTTRSLSRGNSQKVVIGSGSTADIRSQPVPIDIGIPYTLSVYSWASVLNSSPVGRGVVKVEWHDANNTLVNYDYVTIDTVESGFTRHAVTSTPGVGAVFGQVFFAIENGGTINWENAQLEKAAHANAYQDGPQLLVGAVARRITVSNFAIPLNVPSLTDTKQLIINNTDPTNGVDLGGSSVSAGAGYPLAGGVSIIIPLRAGTQVFAIRSGATSVPLAVLIV